MSGTRKNGKRDGSKNARALQSTLVELQALQLQTRQAHWNVSGTLYWPLHEMLDAHYTAIAAMGDVVAERLVAVGSPADGRPQAIIDGADLEEIAGGFVDDAWCLQFFSRQYASVSSRLLERITEIEESDPTSANLLQEVQQLIDKNQWQMRAHFQATPTDRNTGVDIGASRKSAPRHAAMVGHSAATT
jgi:starvation-inducible DNA-binding protein